MNTQRKGMVREVGTALAVLAIYVLTLLAPLHQAAGLQRDLGKLGYETAGFWSVCAPLAEEGDNDTPAAVKCPAAGTGKHDLLAVLPPSLHVTPPIASTPVLYGNARQGLAPPVADHVGQPRAPPVTV